MSAEGQWQAGSTAGGMRSHAAGPDRQAHLKKELLLHGEGCSRRWHHSGPCYEQAEAYS